MRSSPARTGCRKHLLLQPVLHDHSQLSSMLHQYPQTGCRHVTGQAQHTAENRAPLRKIARLGRDPKRQSRHPRHGRVAWQHCCGARIQHRRASGHPCRRSCGRHGHSWGASACRIRVPGPSGRARPGGLLRGRQVVAQRQVLRRQLLHQACAAVRRALIYPNTLKPYTGCMAPVHIPAN